MIQRNKLVIMDVAGVIKVFNFFKKGFSCSSFEFQMQELSLEI